MGYYSWKIWWSVFDLNKRAGYAGSDLQSDGFSLSPNGPHSRTHVLKKDGARGKNRTCDTLLFKQVFYQLNYSGIFFIADLAGEAGVEPASKILEIPVLPLNYTPSRQQKTRRQCCGRGYQPFTKAGERLIAQTSPVPSKAAQPAALPKVYRLNR